METTSEFDISLSTLYDSTSEFMYENVTSYQNVSVSEKSSSTLQLYSIFIPIFGTVIVILNLIVVISSGLILNKGTQPRSTYMFLGNVGMADLITGIAVIFGNAYPHQWRGFTSCCIQLGLIVSTTVASIYSVGLIAIDRFLYILYGLQYQRWVSPLRARLLILLTWLIGFVIGFLPLMGWYGIWDDKKLCWFIRLSPPSLILLTTVIGILPVALVCVLYGIILYHAIQKVIQLRKATTRNSDQQRDSNSLRMFRGGSSSQMNSTTDVSNEDREVVKKNIIHRMFTKKQKPTPPPSSPEPSKWKAIKVVMLTTGSFVITWVPYFVACCMYVYCDEQKTPDKCKSLSIAIASPLAILGFLNSLFNPFIYAWWHKGFRMQIKKQICSITPLTSSKNTSTSSGAKHSFSPKPSKNVSRESTSHDSDTNSGTNYDTTGSTDL